LLNANFIASVNDSIWKFFSPVPMKGDLLKIKKNYFLFLQSLKEDRNPKESFFPSFYFYEKLALFV